MSHLSQKLQTQISELQSKLDSKRSRSKTPVREKANSKQKRHQNRKGPRGKSPAQRGIDSYTNETKRKVKYGSMGGVGDGTHGIDFAKARACVDNINRAHRVAREAKLEVWDHKKRVIPEGGDGKSRFQTHKEWKDSLPKPSLLKSALMEAACKHVWYENKKKTEALGKVGILRYAMECQDCHVMQDNVRDEKTPDNSSAQKLYDIECQEFEAARNVMRSTQGNRPIKFRLSAGFQVTATVTSGVVNTVLLGGTNGFVTPTYASEWATCAALFDEYKLDGGHVDFIYTNPVPAAKVTNLDTLNYMPVIAYDPADNTATSGCLAMTELEHHEVLTPIFTTGIPSTNAISARHKLSFRVPPGPAYGVVSSQNFYGRIWVPTDDTSVNFGAIKFYAVGATITATNVGAGFIYYNTEFRCRE